MKVLEEMKGVVDSIINSYEDRIAFVEEINQEVEKMLEDFHQNLEKEREERERINNQLRETLARNESLRRKDFDRMMGGILSSRKKREEEVEKIQKTVRKKLKASLSEYKKMASGLRRSLSNFSEGLSTSNISRIEKAKRDFEKIKKEREKRREGVELLLKKSQDTLSDFRKERERIRESLKKLASCGKNLKVRDFKETIKNLSKK
jgi:chromosome segregation ATPase